MEKLATLENWDSEAYNAGSYMQNYCVNQILANQSFKANLRVLDLGCGDGKSTANILNYAPSATVLGVDRSPEMVSSANKNYASDRIAFEQQDITHLTVKAPFDQVVSFFCLDWVKDQATLQKNIYQALKPGGQVLFVISTGKDDIAKIVEQVKASDKWNAILDDYAIPAGLHKAQDYKQFMLDAGFTIDHFEVVKIPVELPSVNLFHQFISGLPLFGNVLKKEQNETINNDISKAFQMHCTKEYGDKLICLGEMIVIKACKL